MNKEIEVKLTAVCEIEVELVTTMDRQEVKDWLDEDGGHTTLIDGAHIMEFIEASPDCEVELHAQFPKPDVDQHPVLSFDITEVEVRKGAAA